MTVTLELAKAQCRITHNDHDALLTQYIASAKAWIERFTALLIEEGEVTDRYTEFGDYLTLTRGPFVELTAINYTDTEGEPQVVEGARYQDGKIYPPATGWPAIEAYSTIEAIYIAGYGDAYNPTPEELILAQLIHIEWSYEPDEDVELDEIHNVPLAVVSLASPFRLPTIA